MSKRSVVGYRIAGGSSDQYSRTVKYAFSRKVITDLMRSRRSSSVLDGCGDRNGSSTKDGIRRSSQGCYLKIRQGRCYRAGYGGGKTGSSAAVSAGREHNS